jgi:hypothetical protein
VRLHCGSGQLILQIRIHTTASDSLPPPIKMVNTHKQ